MSDAVITCSSKVVYNPDISDSQFVDCRNNWETYKNMPDIHCLSALHLLALVARIVLGVVGLSLALALCSLVAGIGTTFGVVLAHDGVGKRSGLRDEIGRREDERGGGETDGGKSQTSLRQMDSIPSEQHQFIDSRLMSLLPAHISTDHQTDCSIVSFWPRLHLV